MRLHKVQHLNFQPTRGKLYKTVNTYVLLSVGFVKGSLRIKSEALSRATEGEKRTDLIKVTITSILRFHVNFYCRAYISKFQTKVDKLDYYIVI